jgi:formylglycine-generating enzyme required for sulfatase activity
MSYIFISYSNNNITFARHLRRMLENEGFTTWMDEKKLITGQRWWPEIEKNIIACAAFVVIMSPESEKSDWVEREILVAENKDHKKEIFPILLSGKRWSRLAEKQVEDMTAGLNAIPTSNFINKLKTVTSAHSHVLPPPFEWIDIPGGEVTLEKGGYVPKGGKTLVVKPFQIAKYPITNAQFAVYVEDGGEEPEYWNDNKWNQADCPVVGVSWYEAIKFCEWLNDKINADGDGTDTIYGVRTPGIITLPTEQQWQRAAQGDDGREYPWGNEFDKNRCNTNESGFERNNPVTKYAGKGDSPYGVVDMVGNVWEWCLTDYNTGEDGVEQDSTYGVVHGGSWGSAANRHARCAFRDFCQPFGRSFDIGFRVVCVSAAP